MVSGSDAIDINGDQILVASYRNKDQLQIYSLSHRNKIADIEWEEVKVRKTDESGWLFSAKFSKPDAKFIFASGGGRNEFKVFDNSESTSYRSVA